MKLNTAIKTVSACLAAMVLMAAGPAATVRAAALNLSPQLVLRPLTPSEIKDYALPATTETSGGVSAVGVGQPAYLDILVSATLANATSTTNKALTYTTNTTTSITVTNISWSLTSKPIGSLATNTASPLGTNVPPFRMADRYNQAGSLVSQVAGRSLVRPDITGQYTVAAAITAVTVTNIVVTSATTTNTTTLTGVATNNLSLTFSGSMYLGVQVCEFCHSGGLVAENKYVPWSQTLHASMFSRGVDGLVSSHYSKSCISCHTLGYDTNANANGGFDDVATQLGWTFPTNLVVGNWTNMQAHYPSLANLANIQCENCHGPGSEHAYAFGQTNLANWPRLGVTYDAGDCGQCHDSKTGHVKNAEWNNSLHAVATRTPSGAGREACARCHTGGGFAGYAATLTTNGYSTTYTTNGADTTYTAITCATCHEPHDATNPHQFRTPSSVLLADGVTTVTNGGFGMLCMNCHRSRNGSVTNSIVGYPIGAQTWAGGSSFGPHDNPASDMLEGVNGWTYGLTIPSSAHRFAVSNTCVGCHMQTTVSTDPSFLLAGGHTMKMSYTVVTNGTTNSVDMVGACVQCHGQKSSFDFPVQDYNGDGIVEGVQTEVQHLLDTLSTLLPNSTYVTNGMYIPDGLVKTSVSTKTNWPAAFLKAAYNFQFVANDLSKGVHNAPYATGLLKASIADLTGNSTSTGPLSAFSLGYYQWQVQYFGPGSNTNAAPNANPAGDGVPNWAKYALGLNPNIKGTSVPGGVVWANGSKIYNSTNNAVRIYTAAEVAFNTVVGSNYQIQSISNIGGGWQNIGAPIAGTGSTISYVTPTRANVQQYYRVITQ